MQIKLGNDKIVFGENAVDYLAELPALRKRAFIVMSGTILEETGGLNRVTSVLEKAGFSWQAYTDVEPEPSFFSVKKGAEAMKAFEPDWVIGFGGGSAMDAAKAMWVFYENPALETLESAAAPNEIPKLKEKAHICCIPTSAGTGSEATRAALIKDTVQKKKYSIRCMRGRLIPEVAILDPVFTVTMPRGLTAASGMDVLTHAIETYVTPVANPFSDAMAVAAFTEGYKNLPICYEKGDDLMARSAMLAASTLGGIAFSNAALGLTHSAAHAFGAEFGVPHGLANAVVLPYNLIFNQASKAAQGRYNTLAARVGEDDLYAAIKRLNARLEIPDKMQAIIKEDAAFEARLNVLVDKALSDVCSLHVPVTPTAETMRDYLRAIYYGN